MRIEEAVKLDYSDVLIRPKRSTLRSRQEVDLERRFVMRHAQHDWSGVPIVAANMDTIGTFAVFAALAPSRLATALHKHYSAAELIRFFRDLPTDSRPCAFYSLGVTQQDIAKLAQVLDGLPPEQRPVQYCIDVANGYAEHFVDFVARFRDSHPQAIIMAGNVVTGEMVEELVLNGADIVKVGIGPGSVCTTRKVTGVGYPQLSAVIECSDAAHGLKGWVCADGGCTQPGDLAKAFGAGADFVMLGGMLAGHDECEGEIVFEGLSDLDRDRLPDMDPGSEAYRRLTDGRTRQMVFYGMSSETAMTKHSGGVAEYRASEGKTVAVPYRGPIEETVKEILGGIRSACTYVGAIRLKELSKRTTFVRVHHQLNQIFGTD